MKDLVPQARFIHESSLYLLQQNPGYGVFSTDPQIKIYPVMHDQRPRHAQIVTPPTFWEGFVLGFQKWPDFRELQLEIDFTDANSWNFRLSPFENRSNPSVSMPLEKFSLANRLLSRLQRDINTVFVRTVLHQDKSFEALRRSLTRQ